MFCHKCGNEMEYVEEMDTPSNNHVFYVCEECNAEGAIEYNRHLKEITSVYWKLNNK